MAGKPLALEIDFVRKLVACWQLDQNALECVHICLITFASSAQLAVPLVELGRFRLPDIQACGFSALGKAFSLAACRRRQDVVPNTAENTGNGVPSLILITGSRPTDNWQRGLKELRQHEWTSVVVCVASRGEMDADVLRQVSGSMVFVVDGSSSLVECVSRLSNSWDGECSHDSRCSDDATAGQLPTLPSVIHVEL